LALLIKVCAKYVGFVNHKSKCAPQQNKKTHAQQQMQIFGLVRNKQKAALLLWCGLLLFVLHTHLMLGSLSV
jgi:hypothetical protein